MNIAVVILNWNGKSWLEKFLPSVLKHSANAHIYVADNFSTDDSVAFVKNNHPEVTLIYNKKNYGFAGGYNEALKHVDEDIYVLLNSDVEVTENWIAPILSMFELESNTAAIQPKIKAYHQKTHFEHAGAAGGYIDTYGYPFCKGRLFDKTEKDRGQYETTENIFWASGAALFIRKKAFWEVGGFDEDFFAHMEEIDLCWRLAHKGYEAKYCPQSTVFHVGGGTLSTLSPKKTYLNFRNGLFLLHKNLPAKGRLTKMFARLILDGIAGVYFLMNFHGKHAMAIIKAHFHYYRAIPTLNKKRKQISPMNFDASPVVFHKSLVWAFFIKGQKTFQKLSFKR